MTDQNTKRGIPLKAIPPGINDDRTRTFVRAFNAMADRLDFTSLLMRTGDETSDEALPLAAHDRSLEEFLPPDGLPPEAARRLIDSAWELHARKGTDGGVILGQSLLGIQPHITQWYEQEPVGHHDTHEIKVYLQEQLYDDGPILDAKTQRASLRMLEATKRYSQDTSFSIGLSVDPQTLGLAAATAIAGLLTINGLRDTTIKLDYEFGLVGETTLAGLLTIEGEQDLTIIAKAGLATAGAVSIACILTIEGGTEGFTSLLLGEDGAPLVGSDGAQLYGYN